MRRIKPLALAMTLKVNELSCVLEDSFLEQVDTGFMRHYLSPISFKLFDPIYEQPIHLELSLRVALLGIRDVQEV